jgi:formylglycine-generating enzyme required for sulfatase activity
MRTKLLFIALACRLADAAFAERPKPPGMVSIHDGEFTMGTDEKDSCPTERRAHRVKTDGFWMDETEATNYQFAHKGGSICARKTIA